MEHKVVNDYTKGTSTGNDHIKVFVRARPPNDGGEAPKDMWTHSPKENPGKLSIKDPSRHVGEHAFLFDGVLWCTNSQESVFQSVAKPLVEHCLSGYNGCCFAYGQTGSGKTYSMFGEKGAKRGIIPRCVDQIFSFAEREQRKNKHISIKVEVSFLEMYCDEIRDLGRAYVNKEEEKIHKKMKTSEWYLEKLRSRSSFASSPPPELNGTARDKSDDGLQIHEDFEGNVFVKDLAVIPVVKASEVLEIVERGFRLRATHGTKMNEHSSRSHSVFTVRVTQRDASEKTTVAGVLNLVDLAGSERLGKSESEGQRMRETLFINSSLSALGKVAAALDPSTPSAYIPYRDSKLTRLLQNSLGGNAHTSVIATLNPTRVNYEECLCTLQFANRCRAVVNQPRINYLEGSGRGLLQAAIRRLQSQVRRLRFLMAILLAKKNKQLADILRELGHGDVQVLNDGRVRMADGRVLGNSIDVAAIEKQVSNALAARDASEGRSPGSPTDSVLGGGAGGGGLSGLDGMGSFDLANLEASPFFNSILGGDGAVNPGEDSGGNLSDGDDEDDEEAAQWDALGTSGALLRGKMRRLRLKMKNERTDRAYADDRVKTLKSELRTSETTRKSDAERYAKESRRLRDEVASLRKDLIDTRSTAKSKMVVMRRDLEARIEAVMQNSKQLQQNTQQHLMQVPSALKVDSAKLEKARKQVARLSETMSKKHAEHIRVLLDANQVQVANVQQQAEYWVMQKDLECRRFVADFNAYHRKRTTEVKDLRRELDVLYDYANVLARTFNKMQRGHYKIRVTSREDLLQEVLVRSDEVPKAPALRFRKLKHQAKVLHAFIRDAEKEAAPSVTATAATFGSDAALSCLKKASCALRSNNVTNEPESAVIGSRTDGKDVDGLPEVDSLLDNVEFQGVRLDADTSAMDEHELRTLVFALRKYTRSNAAQRVIEENLLARVSDHPTVAYIRTLEEGLQTYKQSYEAEAAQHKSLRRTVAVEVVFAVALEVPVPIQIQVSLAYTASSQVAVQASFQISVGGAAATGAAATCTRRLQLWNKWCTVFVIVPSTRAFATNQAHHRRLFIGNVEAVGEREMQDFFDGVLRRTTGDRAGERHRVVNVFVHTEKRFAFVELSSPELATACLLLDGLDFHGRTLSVSRPNDYSAELSRNDGPVPALDLSEVKISSKRGSGANGNGGGGGGRPGETHRGAIPDGPEKIFVGGIPHDLEDNEISELLESFGKLRALHVVRDNNTGRSKGFAFAQYEDPAVTDPAVNGLNNLSIRGRTLSVRRSERLPPGSGDAKSSNNAAGGGGGGSETSRYPGSAPAGMPGPRGGDPSSSGSRMFDSNFPSPTNILVLQNMVTQEDLGNPAEREEIAADIREECAQYGDLRYVLMPRANIGVTDVLVEYGEPHEALKAFFVLRGRTFAGRTVGCTFISVDEYLRIRRSEAQIAQ
ncbi:Kinesin-like protein KIF3B [Hondaea fermentalgiana]|uniref:Kinesin-like protein KIF3B n=1 Tax=Hondaea fermentalgiana TaxID=2315210 RepID=A0A2R5GFL6_9STRA|nr:Kinesin-like protein KIF3B [Hondaea fermentalgiana]|eukprot:GBG29365.1 Kinesin-like protein KIF3B [Hondaea fermentalgiana]